MNHYVYLLNPHSILATETLKVTLHSNDTTNHRIDGAAQDLKNQVVEKLIAFPFSCNVMRQQMCQLIVYLLKNSEKNSNGRTAIL